MFSDSGGGSCFDFSFASLPAGIAKFRMFGPSGVFRLDLPTRGAVLGSELRAAVAARFGRRAEELELQQWRGKRKGDGEVVVRVGGGFADEKGKWTPEVEAEKEHKIRDGEAVPEAGRHYAYIYYSFL